MKVAFRILLTVALFTCALAFAVSPLVPPIFSDYASLFVMWPRNWVEWTFVGAGFAGMNLHWANKRRMGETLETWADYFLYEDRAYNIATVVLYWLAAMFVLSTVSVGTAMWPGAVVGGLALGWMLDGVVAPAK